MNVASSKKVTIRPRHRQRNSVLIVAPHALFREGLRAIITLSTDLEVVGLAATTEEALEKAVQLRPALCLVDLCLPDCGGVDLIRRLHRRLPRTRIMVVSPDARPERVTAVLEAGASGLLQRSSPVEHLTQCLGLVSAGGFCVDDRTVRELAQGRSNGDGKHQVSTEGQRLSERETQVLRGMAEGKTLKAVAQELQLSLKTVENHRAHLAGKLKLRSAVDLVRYAARAGVIDIEGWKEGW